MKLILILSLVFNLFLPIINNHYYIGEPISTCISGCVPPNPPDSFKLYIPFVKGE